MMASVVVGGNRRKSLTLRGVDPETCMIVFKNHWAQVVKILEKHEPGRSGTGALSFLHGHASSGGSGALRLGPIPADEASAVQNYVEHMLFLLMEEEAGEGGAMGTILEFVVLEGVMERLFLWSLRRQFTEDMKLEQLRMYQMLLSQARQPLLHHKPVLRPLMMLLASCAGAGTDSGSVVEAELVLLLNQLCVALVKDPSVLELFFHTSEDQGAANFLLFSLLIPYTHRQGSVGQQARDALLLIMSLSASDPRVAQHIAENTYFCPVLATGLSGLYSSLPARLQVYSEDWHCLDQADWQQVPALVHFLHSLDFCSAVTKVAHPSIRSQLLGYIYNGFLVPVLAPALHKLTVEEVMTTTAYLDLFLRSIPEPALLQTFLSFILLHTHDNVHILDTLVSRVNTPFQLGTVSLALFKTLIGLFCEDVMLQLVFRYLIPCSHLSRKQRCSLKQRDCYSSSAASFLLLLPSWCPGNLPNINTNSHSEHIHWPKAADLSVSDRVGYCRGSDFLMDVNYLHYLWDARQAICTSYRACRLWSAPYDGINPLPQEYRSDTPGDDIEEEEEIVPRVKSDSICSLVITPPPVTLSPTLSSSDTVSTGNQAGRASSALELEWDDIFADDDPSLSAVINTALANGSVTMEVDRCTSTPAPPPLPPRHIQEMRRTVTKLVHGSYVEESEFQDDVLVYDLVAQKDTKAAILERIMAANRRARGSISNGQRVSTAATTTTITTMLTTTGRTVMETVHNIMSTRRRSEDGVKDERRRSEDYGKEVRRRRSEDCGKVMGRRKEEGEDEIKRIDVQGAPKGRQFFTNGFNAKNHIIDECDDTDEDGKPFKQNCNLSDFITINHTHTQRQQHTQHPTPCLVTKALPNGHSEFEPHDPSVSDAKSPSLPGNKVTKSDDFLSRYHELMLSLGVEPDCDDITDDISTFRKRVRALRQKLGEEEGGGGGEEFVFSSLWDDGEEEEEEEEEAMEEEGEERRNSSKKGSSSHGVPFTGPFISVLLSRLENLLENSIAVNLLVTGILAQLVSYPQPLLRSFLLSTDTHNQPNVRTLYQVLVAVHAQIERYMVARPDYPALVTQAWRFLLAKDQDSKFRECLQSQGGDIILDPSLPNGSVRNALALPPLSVLPPCPPIPPQAKNRVFAIILFAEFLKELAAIAQEHSIALDCSAEE
ncbi:FHF complex subunit HOOK interacting protein 1A-like isoform X1 [Siniperca chuatsi]|uniref:FHF complex subunit HOOK interacting protein 1A-like isoform X1 n=2 Tax=Siniperca chuatsi TaxID=119488 RepID=UPI001CE1FABB|nr:FHF complex subunit HOOK interacting protein 1A-like isoform X1 [Siniperca chuatsi]XP_044039745.1 FHF complex subunit HOOK interacting protein 1A-like isoform X1 [Siniperca chuatsi]